MKKYLIFVGIMLLPFHNTWAQNEEFQTIFKHKEGERIKVSGFGGPIMNFTAIDNDFALMMGGGCGIIIGNVFLGGYGSGKTNELPFKDKVSNNDDDYILGYGHGGLWLGYIIKPKNAIHLSISSQIGWGAVTKKLKLPEDEEIENIETHAITVLTPIVEIEYNVSRFFKIGTGATWAYITGNNLANTGYSSSSFSKPSFFLSFKVGWFD